MRGIEARTYSLQTVLRLARNGQFGIPRVQREFVWTAQKACRLLDSVYRGLPIGAFVVWRTTRDNRLQLRASHTALPPFNVANKEIWFLIDGQQRLSVVYQAERGESISNYDGKELDFSRICYALERRPASAPARDALAFVYRVHPDPKRHVPVVDIMARDWRRRTRHLPKTSRTRVGACRERLLGYPVYMVFADTNSLDEVREVFVRINSAGLRISSADAAFARATALALRERVGQLKLGLSNGFHDLPDEAILLALALVLGERDVGARAVESALDRFEREHNADARARREFAPIWSRFTKAVELAVDYLQQFGVLNHSYLPSATMVTTLSLFFYHSGCALPDAQQKRELRKWFWATCVGQRYTGRGYRRNILGEEGSLGDVDFFERLAKGRAVRFKLHDRVPRSDLARADYSRKSSLTDGFFCLLAKRRPMYLENADPIPLGETSARGNRRDKHHIFPRGLLKRNGLRSRHWNSICNICFMVAKENQSFGSRRPTDYLRKFRGEKHFAKVMRSHLVPVGRKSPLWGTDVRRSYSAFRLARLDEICRAFQQEAGGMKLFDPD